MGKFAEIAQQISTYSAQSGSGKAPCAFDFETTGLFARKGARAFIMGFTWGDDTFCVDLSDDAGFQKTLARFFSNPDVYYCAHNAKFELSFLRTQFRTEVLGPVWDTEVFARVLNNNHFRYSLDECAKRIGHAKYQPMAAWLKKNGKDQYHNAPRDIVEPYVEHDAYLSLLLFREQYETFQHWEKNSLSKIGAVVKLELATTKNLFEMEDAGLKLDVAYCAEALAYEDNRVNKSAAEFKRLTGRPFIDSRITLEPIFKEHGIEYGVTEKGNPSFDIHALRAAGEHPIVACIMDHREATKRLTAYWENFIELNHEGMIYPNIRQAGTATGRFSAADPNVQNWPKDDEKEVEDQAAYPIRRAFVAPEGFKVVSLDYSQMEYRLVADEAEELSVIEAIQAGTNYHQAVADIAGVPYKVAKSANFARLYGAGYKKLSETLGVSYEEAKRVADKIDEAAPKISRYLWSLIRYAEKHEFSPNWLGRRYHFDQRFHYKYPNYRIQGGCSDILRIAIDDIQRLLTGKKSKLLIPIHDELCLYIHDSEIDLIPKLRDLMIGAHRNKKHLDMDVSISIGPNFHDLEEYHAG